MNDLARHRTAMLLDVRHLIVRFPSRNGQAQNAVDGIDLSIYEGEVVGLVGESGSGKTVTTLALLRLIDPPGVMTAEKLVLRENDLRKYSEAEMRKIRGREIAMIFQNPQASLNPARRIGDQLCDVLRLHRGMNRNTARREALGLLQEVQIKDADRVYRALPRELSGGMSQRVMIAMAISCRPKLLVADEPTASLDVTVQHEILSLLLDLRSRLGMAILLVSHDLGVVAHMCDRIAVMNSGRIVEVGDAVQIFRAPEHPYTRLLLDSILVADPSTVMRPPARSPTEPLP
jgi:ABC-type dipeptide/oligopeptide/nickel transport system ATPase component